MNVKQISLTAILEELKVRKDRDTRKDSWYFSLFRNENTASFK